MATRLHLTKEQAHERAYQRSAQYLAESGLDPTLRAYAYGLRYLAGYPNDNTMRRYALSLRAYFGWNHRNGLDPFQLVRSDVDQYVGFVGRCDYSPKTVKTHLAVARSFHRAAFEDGIVDRQPFRHVRVTADTEIPTRALTPEDINLVLNRIAGGRPTLREQRDYALIYLASRVGPRRKELGLLCWEHLTDTARGSRVRFYRKGGGIDEIDLPPDARAVLGSLQRALQTAIHRRVRPAEPVFPSIGCGMYEIRRAVHGALAPMGLQQITNTVHDRFEDVGLVGPRMATHVLRATAATIAFENGATVDEIRIMLGHKDTATTWTYLKRLNRPSPASHWALEVLPFPGSSPVGTATQLSLFSDAVLPRRAAPAEDVLSAQVGRRSGGDRSRVWAPSMAVTRNVDVSAAHAAYQSVVGGAR